MSTLQANEYVPFEQIKHFSEDGSEFWYAHELSLVLEYVQWRNFAKVLDRAKIACKNSGYLINHHFAEVSKIVEAGATKKFVETPCLKICRFQKRASRRLSANSLESSRREREKLLLDE